MLFALLLVLVTAQVQASQPESGQTASVSSASTAQPVAPSPTDPAAAQTPNEAAATDKTEPAEPEPEAEPALPTRQVCRYVEVAGQRFPVRSCRTVTIYPDERQ